MERSKVWLVPTAMLVFLMCAPSPVRAQLEIGDFRISGGIEVGGLPQSVKGNRARFEEYRDLRERVVIPELQLFIDTNREDFFVQFDSAKLGFRDQNYLLRFGRYGLVDVELGWDQFPHHFSLGVARTPYVRDDGTFTLASKPASTAGAAVRNWVNATATPVDLKLLQGLGRFNIRYTPSPGWTFTGGYGAQKVKGKRAFGALFGVSAGSFNITELTEPIDHLTHNIGLGGEYASSWWSLGLKYSGSLFHNSTGTLVWDNPINLSGVGDACVNFAVYNQAAGTGPCRGRMDLYPSNQAHTFSLSGTASLPARTRLMGTVSYGWRWQDERFLPFTTNDALMASLANSPTISHSSLRGDARPLMVNATLVNNFFSGLSLRGYYRLYDFDNRSRRVELPFGYIRADSNHRDIELLSYPWSYSKQNVGLDAGYNLTRWLSAKLAYDWERMHRPNREVVRANEHSFGPTFDLTPASWLLVRMSYRRALRDAPGYDAGRFAVVEIGKTPEEVRAELLGALRKFDQARRDRDKTNLFAQISPFENLTLHAGFDFLNDRYPKTEIGLQRNINYVPSVGLAYAPADWVTLFTDYNWDRFNWKMKAMERTSPVQAPRTHPQLLWESSGRERVNTVSVGSDIALIANLLNFRIVYGFSNAASKIRASGLAPATDYPTVRTRWHELLTRLEYRVHRNVGLNFGYYFNRFDSRDFGLDIMKPWMGDVDTSLNVQRSIFLGDNIRKPFTAHVGYVGLRFTF